MNFKREETRCPISQYQHQMNLQVPRPMQSFRVPRPLPAARALEAVAEAIAPKDIRAEEAVVAVKVSAAEVVEASAAKVGAPVVPEAVPVDRAAEASVSFSANRKFAASASSAWISSTTRKSRCFCPSCRSAEKFCRVA